MYIYVCARIVAGGAAPSKLPSRYLEVLLEEVPDALEHVPHLALTVGMGAKGFTPKNKSPRSRFPELSHKYRQNPRKSQENHKKTAYRKPHPADVRKRSTSFPLGPNSRFETDDDGTIPLMAKKRPAVARLDNF